MCSKGNKGSHAANARTLTKPNGGGDTFNHLAYTSATEEGNTGVMIKSDVNNALNIKDFASLAPLEAPSEHISQAQEADSAPVSCFGQSNDEIDKAFIACQRN